MYPIKFKTSKNRFVLIVVFVLIVKIELQPSLIAQNPQCDPTKVMTTDTCIRCHGNEVAQWKKTPHYETFESLSKNPRSQEITTRMGLISVKRNDVCTNCHYTMQDDGGKSKPIAGISCESCHGASKDWVALHNDYGGPWVTRDTETSEHRLQRLNQSIAFGMRNTTNIYLIARSCMQCHTVPNEELVDIGGHLAGSELFELVAWSQGIMRHNFARTGGTVNAVSSDERLRVMFVAGLIADLEFSTRAVAAAKNKKTYGVTVAERAGRVALRLFELQKKINDPHVQRALVAFASAELRTNNTAQLTAIANEIEAAGMSFVQEYDPEMLKTIAGELPSPEQYKN